MGIPVCDRQVVWVDLETTGLDPNCHEITQFGGINDFTGEQLELYVWPDHLERASEKALEITGFSEEAWRKAGAISGAEAIQKIVDFLGCSILAGQNVSFDEAFIKATMLRYQVKKRIGYHKLDVATLALIHLRPLGIRSVSLNTICDVLGISNEGEHTALVDAKRARDVYRTLVNPNHRMLDYWSQRISDMNAKESQDE